MESPFQAGAFLQRETDRRDTVSGEEIQECMKAIQGLDIEKFWETLLLHQTYSAWKRLFLGPFE